jgi:hypothetical protein
MQLKYSMKRAALIAGVVALVSITAVAPGEPIRS